LAHGKEALVNGSSCAPSQLLKHNALGQRSECAPLLCDEPQRRLIGVQFERRYQHCSQAGSTRGRFKPVQHFKSGGANQGTVLLNLRGSTQLRCCRASAMLASVSLGALATDGATGVARTEGTDASADRFRRFGVWGVGVVGLLIWQTSSSAGTTPTGNVLFRRLYIADCMLATRT
jgi:hypothetical protein